MDAADSAPAANPLSERELAVLRLLAEGLTNAEIGQRLFLSPETIKWYNRQLYDKLVVSSRGQAVARARELGLLDDDRRLAERPVTTAGLPAALTPFIGREQETAELLALLAEARLVTITGPGGTGKTRLAVQTARQAAGGYAQGVLFVSLAAAGEPDQVAGALAQELGVVERSGRPLVEALGNNLAGKELLLILDNFEHLLPAAPLVADLLAAAPRLTVLATSRELLRLSGEHEYPLSPLSVPAAGQPITAADLERSEAAVLFAQRAAAAAPGFRLTDDNAPAVAAICRRLDGLPLAVELAAAWIKLFPPPQLLERLGSRLALLKGGPRDRPARQRTLRDTIDWSYRLLAVEEQRLFARLAVFVGGRTIEAVEAVCLPDLAIDAVDGLAALFDKSLLYQEAGAAVRSTGWPDEPPRFLMLETIQEFAWDCLCDSGEEQLLRDRHLSYFLALAEEMGRGYRWHGQMRLLYQTAAELNNLRAAFDWAMSRGRHEAAARLVSALDYYFFYQGSVAEGYRWFLRLVPFVEELPRPVRIRYLLGSGRLAWANYQLAASRESYGAALELAREAGDEEHEAWSLDGLAALDLEPDSHAAGMARTEEALTIFRRLDNRPGIAQTVNLQGELARLAGDIALARQKYEAALAASRETGELFRQTMNLANLSMTAYIEGDFERAWELSAAALRSWLELKARQGVISQLAMMAGPLTRLGDPLRAARLLGAFAALGDQLDIAHHPTDGPQMAEYERVTRDTLGEAAFAAAWAEGRQMTLEEAVAAALGE
jgi:predicted ATPase/DNA-binding CsgD family transcriptional regulator